MRFHNTGLATFLLLALLACSDRNKNAIMAAHFKEQMIKLCGQHDNPCRNAVVAQYEACRARYAGEWDAYLNSLVSNDDTLLDGYLGHLYRCIVDADGNPYFTYDPRRGRVRTR